MSRPHFSTWIWLALLVCVGTSHLWFPNFGGGPLNDTYSTEIGGRKALYYFAGRQFEEVGRNKSPLVRVSSALGTYDTLCILGPVRHPRRAEWKAILDWVKGGGRLLIAARVDEAVDFEIPETGLKVSHEAPEVIVSKGPMFKEAESVKTALVGPHSYITWKSNGSVSGPAGMETLLTADDRIQIGRLPHGNGQIVISASDYVFSNKALYDEETHNGFLVYKLLRTSMLEGDRLVFDESLNAAGRPSIEGLLLDPVLKPSTLQLAVLLVVFAWRGNRRFGWTYPPTTGTHHDAAEHSNALGNLYFKLKNSAAIVQMYLDQFRNELRLTRTKRGTDPRALAGVARRTHLPEDELKELLVDAEDATTNDRLFRRDAARIIRRLAQVRQLYHRRHDTAES